MSWLAYSPIVSAVIAVCAAAVAALNARASIKNSNRQFALAYIQEVNKWAAEVVSVWRRTGMLFGARNIENMHLEINRIVGDLFHLRDVGLFLFPVSDSKPQIRLNEMIEAIFSFQGTICEEKMLRTSDAELEGKLRAGFIDSIRNELKVAKRYADAQSYLR